MSYCQIRESCNGSSNCYETPTWLCNRQPQKRLITRGGQNGLIAVLRDLGDRRDDPDSDHIAYLLQELQGSRNMPILQEARAIVADGTDKTARDVLAELEQLFGHYA